MNGKCENEIKVRELSMQASLRTEPQGNGLGYITVFTLLPWKKKEKKENNNTKQLGLRRWQEAGACGQVFPSVTEAASPE